MNLRQNRNDRHDLILQGKFIDHVLKEESRSIDAAIDKTMSSAGFTSSFWKDKRFTVSNNKLEYRHKPQHRFVDMKTRNTQNGKIRKRRHIIHNRVVYGHLNNIARELQFGYTDAVIADFKKLEE